MPAGACLALLLAAGWLVAASEPAAAVFAVEVTEPAEGGSVTGPVTIEVTVDAGNLETIEQVEVRLRAAAEEAGARRSLEHRSGPRSGGRSLWVTALDPVASWTHDSGPMPNGRYVLEARATSSLHTTRWRGHEVRFAVPPPRTTATARVLEHGTRTVEVRWRATDVPDFRNYVVERAEEPDGAWRAVAEAGAPETERTVDTPPGYGAWRYRVVVTRAGADGDTLTTASEPAAVTLARPGATEGGGGAGGHARRGEDPADGRPRAEGGEAGTRDERVAGRVAFTPRRGGGGAPRVGAPQVPDLELPARPAAAAQPRPSPPATAAGDAGFSEYLDYGRDARVAGGRGHAAGAGSPSGGGALTVANRHLAVDQALPPVAGGLLLFVVAGHLLRLARLID